MGILWAHTGAIGCIVLIPDSNTRTYSDFCGSSIDSPFLHDFSLFFAGVSELVSVGCVFIGQSTSAEAAAFSSSFSHSHCTEEDPTVGCSDCHSVYEEVIGGPCAEFHPVDPHRPAYCTVVVRNFGLVHHLMMISQRCNHSLGDAAWLAHPHLPHASTQTFHETLM